MGNEYLIMYFVFFFCATLLFIALAIYFIPVIIAYIRKHNDIIPITILTVLAGWTFLGWLAAVLWSLNSDIKEEDD